jgi:hypothetical protein
MSDSEIDSEAIAFPLVSGSSVNTFAGYLNLSPPSAESRWRRIGILILITWVPLLLLSIVAGYAFTRETVQIPFLHDPALFGRFLFVVPLLEFSELLISISLTVQAQHFLQSAVVADRERPQFDAAALEVLQLRSSKAGLIIIGILSFSLAFIIKYWEFDPAFSTWEICNSARTPAGWWYALISLPILYFFLLHWLWIFLLWSFFLYRVSRLDLQLTPTHPDHAGGLGFLGWGVASFSTVLMAIAAMFSSAVFYEMIHNQVTLEKLKYHVMVFVVIAIAIIYSPLLFFAGRLSRFRFRGLLDFSSLVLRYDRKFEEKWIERKTDVTDDELLGSADIQSLADIASAYGHVDDMRLIPFDVKAFAVLVGSALLPFLPLLVAEAGVIEILKKLGELIL